jgi:hypothetical protein
VGLTPEQRAFERRRGRVRGDLFVFVLSVVVVALSVLMTPSTGYLELFGVTVPELCTWRRWFGVECPGCGMTRSFVFMGHLDPWAAFGMNKLGPFLFAVTAAQIPLRAWTLYRNREAFGPFRGAAAAVTGTEVRSP